MCPSHPNCICGGTLAVELDCNIDGHKIKINLHPSIYLNIKCENVTSLDYKTLPRYAYNMSILKSVTFKDCPLPNISFQEILLHMGVEKTMSLIFQNSHKLSGFLNRRHFTGLQDLTKLLLSVNGITHLPDNVFSDINNLTWLNIRFNNINLSDQLFKPLEKLETLEISHNHLTNMSSNLFSHLSLLRRLSLWQSNITWFSKDFFTGVNVLEELDLSSNGLNELPVSIFKPLGRLKKLTLFSNKFSTLPKNIFSTNLELETVFILNNDVKMVELPSFLFGNLPNLKQIYVQNSGLEIIPSNVFKNSSLLTNISLAYNDIKTLHESTFNDQINLLELDLSHNQLKSLESTIFSSLVRLESLNLCYNSIEEISGSTFSSLLSLIYLNMEHNNLKTISSYIFTNNKQRMIISLAYNKLHIENKELESNDLSGAQVSPFAFTYNLKMLNLSHNNFETAYEDWWINGHDHLDLSFNSIQNIGGKTEHLNDVGLIFKKARKSIKYVWLTNNPILCNCINFHFIDYLQEKLNDKIINNPLQNCSFWTRTRCYKKYILSLTILICSLTLCVIGILICVTFNQTLPDRLKHKFLYYIKPKALANLNKTITVKYSEQDEEFVLKEIIPELKEHKKVEVNAQAINGTDDESLNCFLNIFEVPKMSLVIFTPNYLMTAYSHISIKKIRGAMMKSKNTVYVFTDIGPENSVYAYLKEQRDLRTSVLWNDPNIWHKLTTEITDGFYKIKMKLAPYEGNLQLINNRERVLADMLVTNTSDIIAHSQV
ncbi:putative toll precursor [Danaus plexippus plexippus]|uniref:Toll n=1 Tax=Danaus plexippus plexippus TaxID=278856 RepID=A0A212FFN9_DANPL|nr:putative toll precursor [Danaus plexippus plexippus]